MLALNCVHPSLMVCLGVLLPPPASCSGELGRVPQRGRTAAEGGEEEGEAINVRIEMHETVVILIEVKWINEHVD